MKLKSVGILAFGLWAWLGGARFEASAAPRVATLQNDVVRVAFDLQSGLFNIEEPGSGQRAVQGAHVEVGEWSSADVGCARRFKIQAISDELGRGQCLSVECARAGAPTLLAQFILHGKTNSCVVLKAGVNNVMGSAVRITKVKPLEQGRLFPGSPWSDVRSLNGDSSATQVRVRRSPFAFSANDLLLTFKQEEQRRSIVFGALKTADFTKWIYCQPEGGLEGRVAQLGRAIPGARLVSYLNCGEEELSFPYNGPLIRIMRGEPFSMAQGRAEGALSTGLSAESSLVLEVLRLEPRRRYALGVSWWDHDGAGRSQTVSIVAGGKTNELVKSKPLPAGAKRSSLAAPPGQAPEEWAVALPSKNGWKSRLQFRSETQASAVVSEVWIWELSEQAELPEAWRRGHALAPKALPKGNETQPFATLEASDPVGKLVEAHTTYLPEDSFYLDAGTREPFAALELYGQRLQAATQAQPQIYDFPTICAWYAGVWKTPGAQDHPEKSTYRLNTSPGLVEEINKARERGFLRYSRLAGRLVPDTYEPLNPQGWWDDAHWQRFGYYCAPYETSQKYGRAMHEAGGLAFTYLQPTLRSLLSRDFREQHSDWLCGKTVTGTLDYTAPALREHMRQVTSAMRGGIDGLMVDYCDELWVEGASKGGFSDPHATSTAFYRSFFKLLKDGLGPRSWLHERNVYRPNNDLTLGIVDSQRTSADTDKISPDMVSRSGLRWYKNRVVLNYDMDSKELSNGWKVEGFSGSDSDGRRMMLTMAQMTASRLLLANSLRELSAETLYDLERLFPYYGERRSARPVDAFCHEGWPRVYDLAITPQWHQVVLYNTTLPTVEASIAVPLSGELVEGSLGLNPAKQYLVFDFWNQRFVGRLAGSGRLEQTLRPGEARMLSIHEAQDHPQFISSKRHLLQGSVDLERYPQWNGRRHTLSGCAKVVGGETYELVLAANGFRFLSASAHHARAQLAPYPADPSLVLLRLDAPENAPIEWTVSCEPQAR